MPLPATTVPRTPSPENLPSLTVGRLVFDRYRLEKIAGRGGMGIVWRALDTKLERTVALKFLPDIFFLDHAARDDLKRETRRSLELTHPNIVRIYDFLEDAEMAAISMEFVDGATLSQRRVEQSARIFEPADLEGWTAALCQALDYAHHSACCVHRDLKPGNLMITARGALKVADFGISCGLQNTAARVSVFTSTGGTLGYMSPQQLAGELASPSDDIYSVGATLYELLTSKPPFYSGDLSLQIRETMPEGIAERRAKLGVSGEPVDPRWEATILACLQKEPEARPMEILELAARLGLPSAPREMENRAVIPPTIVERKPIQRPAGVQRPAETRAAQAPALRPEATPPAAAAEAAPSSSSELLAPEAELQALAVLPPRELVSLAQPAHTITIALPGWYGPARERVKRHRHALAGAVAIAAFLALWFRPHPAPVAATHPGAPAAALPIASSAVAAPVPAAASAAAPAATYAHLSEAPLPSLPATSSTAPIAPAATAPVTPVAAASTSNLAAPAPDLPASIRASDAAALAALSTERSAAPVTNGPAQLQVVTVPPGIPFRLREAYEQRTGGSALSGTSPALVEELPLGIYRVEFTVPGLGERSAIADVAKEGVTMLEQSFPHGTVKVTSQPPGAEIFCDEQSVGNAPLELPLLPGSHIIRAEDDDRDSRPRTLLVAAEGTYPMNFDFTDAPKRTAAASARRRSRPKKPAPSTLTKIGRSITNIFTGGDKKK